MKKEFRKFIIVPVDGSKLALKSLDYINRIYGADHDLKVALLHILPSLPPIMIEEAKGNSRTAKQLKIIEEKNDAMGRNILEEAENYLVHKGFQVDAIEKICESKRTGFAWDINAYTEKRLADALAISSSGKGRIEGFFMGAVTNKLTEIIRICPIWILKGDVTGANILIAVDGSENSMRCVDHAGWMLSGTEQKIILFHSTRSLSRFLPKEIFEGMEGIEDTWLREASRSIKPIMSKAREMLVQAGIDASRIELKFGDGSRRPAKDILQAAKKSNAGTIVLGRRGTTDIKDYSMGSVARKVLNQAEDMAVWIVS
jgi:nucleotide-binding universal stress UspA family protein